MPPRTPIVQIVEVMYYPASSCVLTNHWHVNFCMALLMWVVAVLRDEFNGMYVGVLGGVVGGIMGGGVHLQGYR